jgi:hypothetical protein
VHSRSGWGSKPESFDPDQPFEQALATNFLRPLLHQVLDRLENHLEISGNLNPDQTMGDRRSHLRFKFYPEGRSKSDQHLRAEGWFQFSPEIGQHDWYFKFKLPEDCPKHLLLRFETPL